MDTVTWDRLYQGLNKFNKDPMLLGNPLAINKISQFQSKQNKQYMKWQARDDERTSNDLVPLLASPSKRLHIKRYFC